MSEQLLQENHKKPKFSLQESLKTIQKKNKIEALVEEFTNEVTLVTEGLWNDQKNLKDEIRDLAMEQTIWEKKEEVARESLLEEMVVLKKQLANITDKVTRLENKKKKNAPNVLKQISLMVFAFSGAWVLVTLINGILQLIK